VRQKGPLLIFKCLHLDSKSLGFSFKEFFSCLDYSTKIRLKRSRNDHQGIM
jgi:hypothetical protein